MITCLEGSTLQVIENEDKRDYYEIFGRFGRRLRELNALGLQESCQREGRVRMWDMRPWGVGFVIVQTAGSRSGSR